MKSKNKQSKFPVARIKKIMQKDEEVGKVAQATPIVISKALELFLAMVMQEAAGVSVGRGSKKVEVYHLKHAIETTEMLDFLKELVQSIPDPSAGGTIEMEGGKPKAEGSGGGAGGGEGSKRKRRRKEGEGGSGRVRKRKGDEAGVGKEEAEGEAGEEGETKSEMNNKSEPEENDEMRRVERDWEVGAVSVDMRGPGVAEEEEDADDMPYMPR